MTIELFGGGGQLPTYSWASKPASYSVGQPVFISDAGAKGSHWYYDGALWKPLGGECLLASLDATVAGIANSETIGFQYQMPAGLWQVGHQLHVIASCTKSGSTDTGTLRGRIGTAGTTADTQVFSAQVMNAAQRQFAGVADLRLESATSVLELPVTTTLGYGAVNGVIGGATTISSASANSLFVDVSMVSGGTTDTVSLLAVQLFLIGKAN